MDAERIRLAEAERREKHWRRWGPYLSERQWGTVREDYSVNGDAWAYFPFEHAHLRAYRWGEDGLGGVSDNHQRLCVAFALWNGRDPILKERLFGLTNNEGNRGEDVKELYYYLDATPTHSYLKFLYKYPQAEYPYERLKQESRRRSRKDPEFEIWHTGLFDDNRYFDVFWEMAKADVDDLLFRITVVNRGPDAAPIHVLPTIWFRNTWAFGDSRERPVISMLGADQIQIHNRYLGQWSARFQPGGTLLFTDNDTNTEALYGRAGHGFYKDAFGRYVIRGEHGAVRPGGTGTKCAAWYAFQVAPQASATIDFRLSRQAAPAELGGSFDSLVHARILEADAFYCGTCSSSLRSDALTVQRQAFAGLIWTKQFFHYDIETWMTGDAGQPAPPPGRGAIRNGPWRHFFASDILSMPDKWEYPWFAAWDTSFHMIPFSLIDADFAKSQLKLFLREWYMAPNGQIPAYEWNFSDVNPPVHAWSCWRVYTIERKAKGKGDLAFLEGAFHKLMLNFTWWVNRKDSFDNNIFEGGFLGLDNIGVFDRSKPLLGGAVLEQSDATSWMAMFCLNMLRIATELALYNPVYEDIASKFFEHFLFIAEAMSNQSCGLWDEQDGFYYDMLRLPGGAKIPLKVRSLVGLLPLLAVDTLDPEILERLPGFRKRLEWFVDNRTDLTAGLASMTRGGLGERRLLAICDEHKLRLILMRMFDESEFLSPFGIRSLSRFHSEEPYSLVLDGQIHSVRYEAAESETGMFGGNSNWRGPIWFPTNYLLIESLQKFAHYYGDTLQFEFPSRSGRYLPLADIAAELSRRLSRIFLLDSSGTRPAMRHHPKLASDPHFRDHILFFEYFHGDNGIGLGASHQTGWTALVAKLLQQSGE
jgi:hypothetical protein